MSTKEEIEYVLTVNVENAATNIRQVERIAFRTLSLLRRMNPNNPAFGAVVAAAQRCITVLRSLQMTLTLLDAAMAASGNPLALVGFGVGLVTTSLMAGEMLQDNG